MKRMKRMKTIKRNFFMKKQHFQDRWGLFFFNSEYCLFNTTFSRFPLSIFFVRKSQKVFISYVKVRRFRIDSITEMNVEKFGPEPMSLSFRKNCWVIQFHRLDFYIAILFHQTLCKSSLIQIKKYLQIIVRNHLVECSLTSFRIFS